MDPVTGLFWPFSYLTNHSWWLTVLLCLAITPGMMFVVGIVGESRLLPIDPWHQYLSFLPGDLFLSWAVANMLVLAQNLPHEKHWYNSVWWHGIVLTVALGVAVMMTRMELLADPSAPYAFPARALRSPTKVFHNFLLYGGYGYLSVATFVALVAGKQFNTMLLCAIAPIVLWLACLFGERYSSDQTRQQRIENAHVESWKPIWEKR